VTKVSNISSQLSVFIPATSNYFGTDRKPITDCKEALFENLVVLNRMNQRITILRAEVEKRGMRWADAETEEAEQHKDVDMTDAEGRRVNGHVVNTSGSQQGRSAQSGRLTDEDLRRRLQDQMEEDDDDGVHL